MTAIWSIGAPLKPAPFKVVWQKETTEDWDHGSGILETAGTRAQYVTEAMQQPLHPNVLKILAAIQRNPGKKEPGAGLVEERSIILQAWEGVVLERDEQNFSARLYEGFRDFPVKLAEISLEEVAEQRESVIPGARFSWMIGYRLRAGTRTRFSEIYFRRLAPWSREELENAARAAGKLREDAGWV